MIMSKRSRDLDVPYFDKDLRWFRMRRRLFLQWAGFGLAGVSAMVAGCKKDELKEGIYLGSGDVGVLNYSYLLEQLEAAFYIRVTQTFYAGASDAEILLLNDIRDHEIAHREFFKKALGDVAIPVLDFDFSTIDFTSRDTVLEAAKRFEDLGVSAYNGAAILFSDEKYLALTAKIVSVEARHAALIRDLISDGSFAGDDLMDANGLEKALLPAEVLETMGAYITTIINAEDLPTA